MFLGFGDEGFLYATLTSHQRSPLASPPPNRNPMRRIPRPIRRKRHHPPPLHTRMDKIPPRTNRFLFPPPLGRRRPLLRRLRNRTSRRQSLPRNRPRNRRHGNRDILLPSKLKIREPNGFLRRYATPESKGRPLRRSRRDGSLQAPPRRHRLHRRYEFKDGAMRDCSR